GTMVHIFSLMETQWGLYLRLWQILHGCGLMIAVFFILQVLLHESHRKDNNRFLTGFRKFSQPTRNLETDLSRVYEERRLLYTVENRWDTTKNG
ncbi:hypothetical protein LCGC14_2969290, partial [marine sediment metagenome]